MKAEELMIGDWVDWYNSPLCQNGHYYDKVVALDKYEQVCKPIPLTPEILEKNGFEVVGENIWQNDEYCCGIDDEGGVCGGNMSFYTFEDDWDSDGTLDNIRNIRHVHQLQHALRLCGLTELANSIKVE